MDSSEWKTGESDTTVFNNSQSKNTYLGLIELYFGSSIFHYKRKSIHFMKQIGGIILDDRQSKFREKYDYRVKDGKKVLTRKGKTEGPNLIVLPFEEIYDVLMQIHLQNNHASNVFLVKATENKYEIPGQCYNLIPEACNVCSEISDRCTGASQTGIISIIHHLRLNKAGFYNSILIYLDENSEYILIRPTNSNNVHDMSTELFKIFMEFGPPSEVYINLVASKNIETLSHIMKNLCSSCKLIFENKDEERVLAQNVMEAIGTWMRETKSSSWEIGCSVVQHKLNNIIKMRLPMTNVPITARDLFFKNPAIFNNTSELLGRWLKPGNPNYIFCPNYEHLVLIPQNDLETEDPLATDVLNLNIKDEPDTSRLTRQKNKYHYQICFDTDGAAEKEKQKTRRKKNTGKNLIEEKKTS